MMIDSGSRPTETVADAGKYVYCIIRLTHSRAFGSVGIGGARVYVVRHQDLAAVVSDTPIVIHDPTRENVLAHEFVNETVMREFTVIPMSFGAVFRSEEDVAALLRCAYQLFYDLLDRMQDKIELGLKALWDRAGVIAEIERGSSEIHRLKDEISRNARSSTYLAQMRVRRLIEVALEDRAKGLVTEVHRYLEEVAVAIRGNKPIGDRMIMNAAFLVERDLERLFDEKVQDISRRYDDVLTFKYTGPWPPYNFVNIKFKLERA